MDQKNTFIIFGFLCIVAFIQQIQGTVDIRNEGKQCWYKCGGKGGKCESFCGKDAICCRLNWGDVGCEKAAAPCDRMHCCSRVKEVGHQPEPEVSKTSSGIDIKNEGKQCWYSCGAKGGKCESFCGKDAVCCRLNYKSSTGKGDVGCENAAAPCRGMHCCSKVTEVKNKGKECWENCGKKGGKCDNFCGTGGVCCRRGWQGDVGCEKASAPCATMHCCSARGKPNCRDKVTGCENAIEYCGDAKYGVQTLCPKTCGLC